MDRTKVIFGNELPDRVVRKAEKSKAKFRKKFQQSSSDELFFQTPQNECLYNSLGVKDLKVDSVEKNVIKDDKGIIIGNIRMGFGHYRISIAIASAAHAMGYTPYWMDLASYDQTVGGQLIQYQNELYSKGSRISSKSKLFNRFFWEPMNYEGFRKLSYNAADQKNAELMAPLFEHISKEMPFVATHVWPAQAAIHGGMKQVVNAIPDNWPMALHLAQGSVHTVQTHSSYYGYRTLHGMQKNISTPMQEKDICYTGHYVDHEMVFNLEEDCNNRMVRMEKKEPLRILLTVGGAGAQRELFRGMIQSLMQPVNDGKILLLINVGDYRQIWEEFCTEITGFSDNAVFMDDAWDQTKDFANQLLDGSFVNGGIVGFYHSNIFEAVYGTNLLMRGADILVTKPSELSFYPVPKLFIHRVGGHEKWGAIHSAEIGDGTIELEKLEECIQMLQLLNDDRGMIQDMCKNIIRNKKMGIYDGAYKVIELAMQQKK